VRELEEMGLYFRRAANGELIYAPRFYRTNLGGAESEETFYRRILTNPPGHGAAGRSVMDVLVSEVSRRGINVMEEVRVTALLTHNGNVVGATAFDYVREEFIVIKAKATILATGHGGYFWTYATYTRDVTGDGMALAYRIGAELQGIEICWWHFGDMMKPRIWSHVHMHGYPMPISGQTPYFYNSQGERFMNERYDNTPYWKQALALRKQVKEGKAKWRGGYFAGFAHMDQKELAEYYAHLDFIRKLGLDPARDKVECGMTGHIMAGGIKVSSAMETNIPGLYVAGGAGAIYALQYNTTRWSAILGARSAVRWLKNTKSVDLDEGQVEKERAELRELRSRTKGTYNPAQVKRRIRDIMWENMHFIKSEEKMTKALGLLRETRERMLPELRMSSGAYDYDLVDALDVKDMLDVSELMVQASLMRKESRGFFQREDYPRTDNVNWLKHITIRRDHQGRPTYYSEAVNLKYVKPEGDVQYTEVG